MTDDTVTPEARLRERIFALPTDVDGGIVYTDPHVRLSDVVAALDAYEEWVASTPSEPGLRERSIVLGSPYEVELVKRVVTGWFGGGTDSTTWGRAMTALRAALASEEPPRDR